MERASWKRWARCALCSCLALGCGDGEPVEDEQPASGSAQEGESAAAGIATEALQAAVRIDTGSSFGHWDAAGQLWSNDRHFADGTAFQRGAVPITGTADETLYQTERFGVTRYSVPVSNGLYTVKLHFAETYEGITGPGQRVFGLRAEAMNLGEVDVFARAGGRNRALVLTHYVRVADGVLDLRFLPIVQNTLINAIEILPPEPAGWLGIDTGASLPYLDTSRGVWQSDFGYEGGTAVDRGNITIEWGMPPHIYQTERFGMSSYEIDLPNGSYVVGFHFIETYEGITGPGQRVFVPEINGSSTWNVDVFGETGGRQRATTFFIWNQDVTDQHMHIGFTPRVQNAMVSGLEIWPEPPF